MSKTKEELKKDMDNAFDKLVNYTPHKLITPPEKPKYKHKKGQKDIVVGLFSDPIGTMGNV